MPRFLTGTVIGIASVRPGLARVTVDVAGAERPAAALTGISGEVSVGDRVVVNATAVDLGLGTGGEDFVVWNLDSPGVTRPSGGHIMKLRYTPTQIDTLAIEAPESPAHSLMSGADSLDAMPVVACGVHSQVPAAAAAIKKAKPGARVAYLMTDAGALPMVLSDLVHQMKECGVLDATLTSGHAFGGDIECVNMFSAMVAARVVAKAAVLIVSPGPGLVGTQTALGHSGMDQSQVLSAAWALGGTPVAALRISFADPRARHRVVSHHTISALRFAAAGRVVVAVPELELQRQEEVLARLSQAGVARQHEIRVVDCSQVLEAMETFGLAPTTMGRTHRQDPEFFLAAGAAGLAGLAGLGAGGMEG